MKSLIIKPSSLRLGSKLGIISLTLPITTNSDENIEKAYNYLKNKGFKIIEAPNCRKNVNGAAGSIQERVEALHNFFMNSEIDGILCFNGGWYTNQLIEYLDYELIRQNPKPLIGFSDTTSLQNAIFSKTGLITFSGPMAVSFISPWFPNYTWNHFDKVLIDPQVSLQIEPSREYYDGTRIYMNQELKEVPKPNTGWKIFRSGQGQGRTIGGNLCALLYLAGTEYFPNMKDKILFLEDGGDESMPPTLTNSLTQLRQMGVYKQVKGLVIGRFSGNFGFKENVTLETILESVLQGYEFPVITDVDFGHTEPLITIPIGINCLLDATKPEIIFLESGVEEKRALEGDLKNKEASQCLSEKVIKQAQENQQAKVEVKENFYKIN